MIGTRNERAADAPAIDALSREAFKEASHSSHTEYFIVAALRKANALAVSLVAEADGMIVGYVAICPVSISGENTGWFGLGPLSVLPKYQRQGIAQRRQNSGLKMTSRVNISSRPNSIAKHNTHLAKSLMPW